MNRRWLALTMLASLTLFAASAGASGFGPKGPGNPGAVCPNPSFHDDDGDGIPNGQDPDYVPPRDGSGRRVGSAAAAEVAPWQGRHRWRFTLLGVGPMLVPTGLGWGPGDGSGNNHVGPRDGTGYGPGGFGAGACDGTGPNGTIRRGR